MIVNYLFASLTEAYFYKINNKESKYMIHKVPSTALLYKIVMRKVIIDVRVTTYKFKINYFITKSKNLSKVSVQKERLSIIYR